MWCVWWGGGLKAVHHHENAVRQHGRDVYFEVGLESQRHQAPSPRLPVSPSPHLLNRLMATSRSSIVRRPLYPTHASPFINSLHPPTRSLTYSLVRSLACSLQSTHSHQSPAHSTTHSPPTHPLTHSLPLPHATPSSLPASLPPAVTPRTLITPLYSIARLTPLTPLTHPLDGHIAVLDRVTRPIDRPKLRGGAHPDRVARHG